MNPRTYWILHWLAIVDSSLAARIAGTAASESDQVYPKIIPSVQKVIHGGSHLISTSKYS